MRAFLRLVNSTRARVSRHVRCARKFYSRDRTNQGLFLHAIRGCARCDDVDWEGAAAVMACTFEKARLHANSINSESTGLYILLLFRDTQTSCLELANARAGAAAPLVNRRLFRYEKFVCRLACPPPTLLGFLILFSPPAPACSRYIFQLRLYSILLVAEVE